MNPYYKYLPIKRIDYLKSELLRFTQPIDLNDPFECLPGKPPKEEFEKFIQLKCEELVAKAKSSSERNKIIERAKRLSIDDLYKNANRNVNLDIGILSLSKNWNSTLMWSHYSDCHKGYCIGFNKNHSFFNECIRENGTKSKVVKEVIYSKDRVQIPMDEQTDKLIYEPFITKACGWNYEQEIRVISSLNLSQETNNGEICDIHLFKVPYDTIQEIIMGVNISPENEKKIKEFSSRNKIQIFKCKISDKEFNMERE